MNLYNKTLSLALFFFIINTTCASAPSGLPIEQKQEEVQIEGVPNFKATQISSVQSQVIPAPAHVQPMEQISVLTTQPVLSSIALPLAKHGTKWNRLKTITGNCDPQCWAGYMCCASITGCIKPVICCDPCTFGKYVCSNNKEAFNWFTSENCCYTYPTDYDGNQATTSCCSHGCDDDDCDWGWGSDPG